MALRNYVATLATIFTGITAVAAASTPGFALQIAQSPNAQSISMVPAVAVVQAAPETTPPAVDPADPPPAASKSTPSYASLADAVAAQSDDDARSDDLQCLAGAIYYESKGEPLSGQLAVAEVIINRSKSGRFPGSICSVVTQPGQFSFVRGGRVPEIDPNRNYRTALAVARVALADAWDSPAPKALFFHARRVNASFNRTQVAAIGNHVFFR